MSIIKFDRLEDETTNFVAQATELMPLDIKILGFKGDDATGCSEMWENPRHRYFRNLCYYVALDGILPKAVKDAYDNGVLYSFVGGYHWTGDEGISLPELDPTKRLELKGAIALYDPKGLKDAQLQLKISYEELGVKFITPNQMYSEKIREATVSKDDFICYLENIGGKVVNGDWNIKFRKYSSLTIRYDEDKANWVFLQGTQELDLRNYFAISSVPLYGQPHKMALLVVNYLMTSFDENDFKGRLAYMSGVFKDITSVGFEHKLLSKFKHNKVGLLQIGVANAWLPLMTEGGDMVAAAKAYEKLGFSVFMHKGAKYIVVDAGMTGFARTPEGKTQVAWAADKAAKLTGRALWNVPTAVEYIDDDED